MGLTDRGITQTAGGGAITMAVTSAAFTATAGEMIVIALSANVQRDGLAGSSDITFVITDNIGDTGGTAWSNLDAGSHNMVSTKGAVTANQYMGKVEFWWRVIGTTPGASKTITATGSARAGAQTTSSDGHVWMDVLEVTGQAGSPAGFSTGATGISTAGPSSLALALNGTPASTSIQVSVIQDFDTTTGTPTVPASPNWTQLNNTAIFDNISDAFIASGGSTTSTWTTLTAADRYLGATFEIVTAGAAFDPTTIQPRWDYTSSILRR